MSKQEIVNFESPLLDKLIEAYNENGNMENKLAVVNLDNRELRTLILALKNELAREAILDYELFQRREKKIEFLKNKSKSI